MENYGSNRLFLIDVSYLYSTAHRPASSSTESIVESCQRVAHEIEVEFGGVSATPDVFVVAFVASMFRLQRYLEIEV